MPLYARAPAERLPFADATFSAVLSTDFLEHVPDMRAVVREAARVLAPGGLFLYDTINRTWLTLLFHIGVLQEWRRLVPAHTHTGTSSSNPVSSTPRCERRGSARSKRGGSSPPVPYSSDFTC